MEIRLSLTKQAQAKVVFPKKEHQILPHNSWIIHNRMLDHKVINKHSEVTIRWEFNSRGGDRLGIIRYWNRTSQWIFIHQWHQEFYRNKMTTIRDIIKTRHNFNLLTKDVYHLNRIEVEAVLQLIMLSLVQSTRAWEWANKQAAVHMVKETIQLALQWMISKTMIKHLVI